MAAVRLHEFREGIIVPHEKTLAAPKADRLEIMQARAARTSRPIFGLYRDEAEVTARTLDAATAAEPVAETDSDDGVHHRVWRTEDPALVSALTDLVARQRIFIADGHHRYETALVYRRQLEEANPGLPADGGHHYILMFLCPMNDPGLFLFPTHRLLFGLKDFPLARLPRRPHALLHGRDAARGHPPRRPGAPGRSPSSPSTAARRARSSSSRRRIRRRAS